MRACFVPHTCGRNERQVNRLLGILNENQEDLDDLALGIRVGDNGQPSNDPHIEWPKIGSQPNGDSSQ